LSTKSFIQQLLKEYPLIKGKVVLELNESEMDEAYMDNPEFKEKIAFLKEKKFLIALDDIGKVAITLQKIKEIDPHYLKVDRFFGDNLHSSKEKEDFISVLVKYSKNKMELILEGMNKRLI
jgi:EAL domain-containing protein (putative c-di-GMP-specific phosphodiesterase class I)